MLTLLLLLLLSLNLLLLLINLNCRTVSGLFLKSLRIPQSVESVIGGATARTDARKHDYLGLLTLHKGVTEHHCQLASPKGDVLALTSLALLSV